MAFVDKGQDEAQEEGAADVDEEGAKDGLPSEETDGALLCPVTRQRSGRTCNRYQRKPVH